MSAHRLTKDNKASMEAMTPRARIAEHAQNVAQIRHLQSRNSYLSRLIRQDKKEGRHG